MRALLPLISLAGCAEQAPEIAVVQEAIRAAKDGNSADFAKVAGSAELLDDNVARAAKLADFVPRCALDEFEVQGSEVIANGMCSQSENPGHTWPYGMKFNVSGNKVTSVEHLVSEW